MYTDVPVRIRHFILYITQAIILFIATCTSLLFAQMPPHPRLQDKISAGEIQLPEIQYTPAGNIPTGRSIAAGLMHSDPLPEKMNFLVVLVDFDDKKHSVPAEYFDSLIFSSSPLSLKSYFSDISCGRMNFTAFNLPSNQGWVRAPEPYSYYISGGNYGMGSYPNNVERLVEDIVKIIDPKIDFSKYDNDNDGYVDGLIIVHSGCGAEYSGSSKDIWSHNWIIGSLESEEKTIISKYVICPEYYFSSSEGSTIGVFAHEFSHSYFGLADLYDSDNSSKGLGRWSLMSNGCWNGVTPSGGDMPAFPDAFSRILMGFAKAQALTENKKDFPVKPSETDSLQIFKIWGDGKCYGKEYFLLENRRRKGFDRCLPGEGILIYHIDENAMCNVFEWYPGHTSSGHYMVALEQADSRWDLERNVNYGDDGDPYPGSKNNNIFSMLSSPDSKNYLGRDSKVSISDFRPSGDTMLVDINITMGYAGGISVLSPDVKERISPDSDYTIKWVSANISKVGVQYSTNGGTSWNTIARGVESSKGELLWHVPKIFRAFCKVRVADESYPSYYAESGLFSITTDPAAGKPASPGDLIFTQVNSGVNEGFELLAMNDIDITDLKIINVKLTDQAAFSEDILLLDMNLRDMGYFTVIRKGTLLRFMKDKTASYEVDSTGKVLIIYYPEAIGYPYIGRNLSMSAAPLVIFRGRADKPLIIAGFDLVKSPVSLNPYFFRPNTFPGILPAEIVKNYWFKESISDNDSYIRKALKTPDNWAASNSQLKMVEKQINFLDDNARNALLDLSGEYFNNSVEIRWWTLNEENNRGWQVERRTLNSDWVNLGFVESPGHINDPAGYGYSFTDRSITPQEVYYYRLRQISLNDSSYCSHNIKISAAFSSSFELKQNYPNPFNGSTTLKFSLPEVSSVRLIISNSIGQTIQEIDMGTLSPGVSKTELNLDHLASGIYFYTFQASPLQGGSTFIQTKKMAIIK